MFGWRKRIGYISPTVIEMTGYSFYNYAPEGVGLVGVTCNIDAWARNEFDKALAVVLHRADYLASRNVDFIIHAGEPLVTSRGGKFDTELIGMIEARTGIPATTTVRAAMDGLDLLGIRKVGIASPYPPAMNETLASFLTGYGYDVVKQGTLDVPFKETQFVRPETIYRFVADYLSHAPALDGLYMPCPQWPVSDIVDRMERDFGIPIVAGDPADYSAAFRGLGIRDVRPGYGRLFAIAPGENAAGRSIVHRTARDQA